MGHRAPCAGESSPQPRSAWTAPPWFSIYVTAAIGISVGLVWLLARAHEAVLGSLTVRILPLATLFALGVDPGRCFGQREHLLMVAAMPYLVLRALRVRAVQVPRWQTVLIALIAGLGFAIKPHFVLPLLARRALRVAGRGLRADPARPGALVDWHACSWRTPCLPWWVPPEYLAVVVPFAAEAYTTPAPDAVEHGQIWSVSSSAR